MKPGGVNNPNTPSNLSKAQFDSGASATCISKDFRDMILDDMARRGVNTTWFMGRECTSEDIAGLHTRTTQNFFIGSEVASETSEQDGTESELWDALDQEGSVSDMCQYIHEEQSDSDAGSETSSTSSASSVSCPFDGLFDNASSAPTEGRRNRGPRRKCNLCKAFIRPFQVQ